MSDDQFDAALDLLRRLNPRDVQSNLNTLCQQNSALAEELLATTDVPLTIKRCPSSGASFLCCDYNRDGDSHRSPHSNKFVPELEDAPDPLPAGLRKLEVAANEAFDTYRELYFEQGLSSVYLWPAEDGPGFAGVVLLKKEVGVSFWDSIHVFEVSDLAAKFSANYKITSTVIVDVNTAKQTATNKFSLSGNLTRQTELDLPVQGDEANHIANLGSSIEEIESKMRNSLNEIYFGKTRDILGSVRTVEKVSQVNEERKRQQDAVKGLS